MNEETRIKKSKAMLGNKNGLGHPCSEEKKEKIRQSQIGMVFSEERKQKMSEAAKKRHVPCSEEKRESLRHSYPHMKKVYCRELDEVFESVQSCARAINAQATNVSKACKGKIHTISGYHLNFYEEE